MAALRRLHPGDGALISIAKEYLDGFRWRGRELWALYVWKFCGLVLSLEEGISIARFSRDAPSVRELFKRCTNEGICFVLLVLASCSLFETIETVRRHAGRCLPSISGEYFFESVD